MFRGLIDLFNLLLWWSFMYVGSFLLMVVAIVHIIKTNSTPLTPIIHEHYSTIQMTAPPQKVLVGKEICTRLDGCPIVNNVCVDCLTEKN